MLAEILAKADRLRRCRRKDPKALLAKAFADQVPSPPIATVTPETSAELVGTAAQIKPKRKHPTSATTSAAATACARSSPMAADPGGAIKYPREIIRSVVHGDRPTSTASAERSSPATSTRGRCWRPRTSSWPERLTALGHLAPKNRRGDAARLHHGVFLPGAHLEAASPEATTAAATATGAGADPRAGALSSSWDPLEKHWG